MQAETTTTPDGRTTMPDGVSVADRSQAPTAFEADLETAIRALPPGLRTRFAPAPTGYLHLGHVASALVVWRVAAETQGEVVLRIEDHDRQRCRPGFEAALLDDLDALGFVAHVPPSAALRDADSPSAYRQSDNDPVYAAAVRRLEAAGDVYACDCSRSTFADWANAHEHPWSGSGCPSRCVSRRLPLAAPGVTLRAALGDGDEGWTDLVLGPQTGPVAVRGDVPIKDRNGNWTYALCVVTDDIRHGIDLVARGEDLLDATPAQIRLGRLLGRDDPPRFLHHPLIRRPDGRKLSKADRSTAIRDLLATGLSASPIRDRAAAAIGLRPEG